MTLYPWPRGWQVGVQVAGGRHLCMRWGLSSVDVQGSIPMPFSSSLLDPYLLGLGRGLRREAGAGTFRDPAVSVMRAHQLGRQDKTRGVGTPKPHPVQDTLSHHPWGLSLFAFRRCLCHQLIYLGLLVPGKNDVESFVICIGRGEM